MLTLTLEAETYAELARKAADALNLWQVTEVKPAAVTTAVETKTDFGQVVAKAINEEVKTEQVKIAKGKGKAAKEEEKALISTGEERVDPAEKGNGAAAPAPEPAPEPEPAAPAITHQSIRDLMGTYANTFGMKAVQQDGPIILSRLFGEGKVRASDIPDNIESLTKAYDAINKAIETNEFKRSLAS